MMIMILEPVYLNREPHCTPWRVTCTLCNRQIGSKQRQYPTRWSASKAAASHLWAHRSDHPPKPQAEAEPVKSVKVRRRRVPRAQLIAQLTAGHPACPHPAKRKHISKEEAERHIRLLEAADRGNPDYMAYLCKCGLFHVGHSKVKFEHRIKSVVKKGR